MAANFTIVGIGEALFDVFPEQSFLGGAPLNLVVHAQQLAASRGGRATLVSRIGQDELGQRMLRELQARGLSTETLQQDPDHDTGKVYVDRDALGQPSYDIVTNVAWDWISFDFDVEALAKTCEAVCFGSLAQRNSQSRQTIQRFLDTARRAIRLFDVNLRQNFYDRHLILRSCELSTALKLNEHELPVVCGLVGLNVSHADAQQLADQQAQALLKKFNLKLVALTRGARGTVFYSAAGRLEGQAVSYPSVPNADAVGAGDACGAAILLGMVQRMPLEKTLKLANQVGAYVASQAGAVPVLPREILDLAI